MISDGKNRAYFVGIGGIGMSALARWYNHAGYLVAGYDRTYSPLVEELVAEGMSVTCEDAIDTIPDEIKNHKEKVTVIFTPAIPRDSPQLEFFRNNGFEVIKRSEALGRISNDHFTIAVAGTHGKTTTSTMIAHILNYAGKNSAAFLGGISSNYHTNFLIKGDFSSDTIIVAEADEFDRSFLRLSPNVAVITSTDADHLDIYGDKQSVHQSYGDFIKKIAQEGKLILNQSIPDELVDSINVMVQKYGEGSDCRAENIKIENGNFIFDFVGPTQIIEQVKLMVPGFHNVENATAAIQVALCLKINAGTIKSALAEFTGVKRRFEYIIKSEDVIFIDDYAHHPTEIEALLTSVKALYQEKKITAIFQPHLYSRTRDFTEGFAQSLSLANEVLLLDIYPARERPIPGITSKVILDKIVTDAKRLLSADQLMQYLNAQETDVVLTIGAGDIDKLIPEIKEILLNKKGGANE